MLCVWVGSPSLRRSWSYPWLTAVICEWNWMESWLFMILERTRSNFRISHVQIFCSYFDISIFGFTFFWLARRIGRCFSSGSPRRTSGFFSGAFNRHITTLNIYLYQSSRHIYGVWSKNLPRYFEFVDFWISLRQHRMIWLLIQQHS